MYLCKGGLNMGLFYNVAVFIITGIAGLASRVAGLILEPILKLLMRL